MEKLLALLSLPLFGPFAIQIGSRLVSYGLIVCSFVSMAVSQNEQNMRSLLETCQQELARASAAVVHYETKIATYEEEMSPEAKTGEQYARKLNSYTTHLEEARAAVALRKQQVPQLESAIRDMVVASVTASLPVVQPTMAPGSVATSASPLRTEHRYRKKQPVFTGAGGGYGAFKMKAGAYLEWAGLVDGRDRAACVRDMCEGEVDKFLGDRLFADEEDLWAVLDGKYEPLLDVEYKCRDIFKLCAKQHSSDAVAVDALFTAHGALPPDEHLSVFWLRAALLQIVSARLEGDIRILTEECKDVRELEKKVRQRVGLSHKLGGVTTDSDGDTFMGAFGRGGRGGPPPRSGRGGGGKGGGGTRSRSDERWSGSTFRGTPQRQASQRGRCYAFLHQGRCMRKDCPYTHTRSPTPERPKDRASGAGGDAARGN